MLKSEGDMMQLFRHNRSSAAGRLKYLSQYDLSQYGSNKPLAQLGLHWLDQSDGDWP